MTRSHSIHFISEMQSVGWKNTSRTIPQHRRALLGVSWPFKICSINVRKGLRLDTVTGRTSTRVSITQPLKPLLRLQSILHTYSRGGELYKEDERNQTIFSSIFQWINKYTSAPTLCGPHKHVPQVTVRLL